jgi:hypothetical protein
METAKKLILKVHIYLVHPNDQCLKDKVNKKKFWGYFFEKIN